MRFLVMAEAHQDQRLTDLKIKGSKKTAEIITWSWCFPYDMENDTVDGSEISAIASWSGKISHHLQGFIHVGWCRILPSTVSQWIIIYLKAPPYQDASGHQDHDTFRDPELSLLLLIFTMVRSDVTVNLKMFNFNVHTGRLTWNLKMMVCKMSFLFNWVSFWFHVNLPGCKKKQQTKLVAV